MNIVKLHLFLLIAVTIFFTSCNSSPDETSLIKIQHLADINPDSAKIYFDKIEYKTLSNRDRHLYDFLKIKINDKLRVKHTNDSLILDVIKYYNTASGSDTLYTEALYYGGRVYSDLGDYPKAQQYFQAALDRLPNDTPNHLRGRAMSQFGRLLNKLRLYDEAIPYIEDVIKLEQNSKDTFNLVSNLNLLGAIQIHLHDYYNAKKNFKLALELAKNLPSNYRAKSRMYIADVYSKTNNPDSALIYLKLASDSVSRGSQNTLLAIGVLAYYNAGKYDSTYVYAKKLIESNNEANKQTGYYFLMQPELRKYSGINDLIHYACSYFTITDTYFDNNQNNLSLTQRAQFNYEKEIKARLKIEKINKILKISIICLFIIISVLTILLIRFRNKEKSNIKNLLLKSRNNNETFARATLQSEILDRVNTTPDIISPDPIITNSTAYKNLLDYVNSGKIIGEDNQIWKELESMLLKNSPRFIDTLNILSGGKYTLNDLQTVILVKCFVQPKDMEKLLSRSKGTIVSRRTTLSKKLFDTILKTETIDKAIRLL